METESLIQQAIQDLAGTRTIIVISHRLSTVKRADKILVIDKGNVAETGTHFELISKPGLYRRLCEVQFQGTAGELLSGLETGFLAIASEKQIQSPAI